MIGTPGTTTAAPPPISTLRPTETQNGFRADAGIAQQAMAKVVPGAGGGGSTATIKKTTYTLGAGGAGGSSPGNSGAAGPAVATLSSP
jgi:hypothetical protein